MKKYCAFLLSFLLLPGVHYFQVQQRKIIPRPTIRVLYPNGGETWQRSRNYTIRWESLKIEGDVKILCKTESDALDWIPITENTANDGSFTYSWGQGFLATQEQFKIRIQTLDGRVMDDSDRWNYISPPTDLNWSIEIRRNDRWLGIVKVNKLSGPGPTQDEIICGTNWANSISLTFPHGSIIELEAVPIARNVFRWEGACRGTNPICRLEMIQNYVARAVFEKRPVTMHVTVGGSGDGTVLSAPQGINCTKNGGTCEAEFLHRTVVTLVASPAPGSRFVHWTTTWESFPVDPRSCLLKTISAGIIDDNPTVVAIFERIED